MVEHPRPFAVLAALLFLLFQPDLQAAPDNMTRYQHKTGLSFSYPDGWMMKEDEEGLYLVPHGQEGGSAPTEYLFLSVAPAPEIASARDPMVAAYFEKMLSEQLPGSRRDGPVEPVESGLGPGVVIPFTGEPGGVKSRILVYVVVQEEEGLYLVHVRDEAASSDPQAGREVFASLALNLRIDPDLTGTWTRTSRSSSTVGSVDPSHFSNTFMATYRFDGAGNVTLNTDSSSSSVADNVTIIDNDASYHRSGKYSSLGEELYIEWEDGTEATWNYSVFPDYYDGHLILKLTDPDTEEDNFYNRSD